MKERVRRWRGSGRCLFVCSSARIMSRPPSECLCCCFLFLCVLTWFPTQGLVLRLCACTVCTWWPCQSKVFPTPRDVDKANTNREYLVSLSVVKGKCNDANPSVTLFTEPSPYNITSGNTMRTFTANLQGCDICIQKTT